MNVNAYRRTARIAGRYQYFSRKAAVGGRRVRLWSFRYAALTSIGRVRADIMCTAPGEQHCSDDGSSVATTLRRASPPPFVPELGVLSAAPS